MGTRKPSRREFLQASVAGITVLNLTRESKAPETAGLEPNAELVEITIFELQSKMKSGEISAKRLVEMYLERIKEIDPRIKSVLEINPDALQIAERADKERQRGRVRSMMHGIPVLIKDNIDTADKMKTTAGSLALLNAPTPKSDAFIVKQLRSAGAVILGKTNLSEWANFRSTKSISGWSGRGGQTNNPYVLNKNPCGSSSGSAAAVSANLATVGIGTETNGSIICPAVRCGVVGLKPSLGLISRTGIIPIAHSQDTAGPLARTVADAAILLGVLIGKDRQDSTTGTGIKEPSDYTRFLDKNGLSGARIGVTRRNFDPKSIVGAVLAPHLRVLEAAGATLIDVTFPPVPNLNRQEEDVLLYEFKTELNKYLALRRSPLKTLRELIEFNDKNKAKEMPVFAQELFLQADAKGDLTEVKYTEALQNIKQATQADGIDAVINKDNLDAVVSSAGGATWSLAAIAGYPYITIPAGFVDGLPVGMAFFGRAFSEPTLIKFAYAFEQRTRKREPPKYLPTYP